MSCVLRGTSSLALPSKGAVAPLQSLFLKNLHSWQNEESQPPLG